MQQPLSALAGGPLPGPSAPNSNPNSNSNSTSTPNLYPTANSNPNLVMLSAHNPMMGNQMLIVNPQAMPYPYQQVPQLQPNFLPPNHTASSNLPLDSKKSLNNGSNNGEDGQGRARRGPKPKKQRSDDEDDGDFDPSLIKQTRTRYLTNLLFITLLYFMRFEKLVSVLGGQ